MEKKSDNFSMEDAQRLAQSQAGQQLMAMLQGNQNAAAAMESARNGDLEKAKQALTDFLSDPRAQALLQQLQEDSHG